MNKSYILLLVGFFTGDVYTKKPTAITIEMLHGVVCENKWSKCVFYHVFLIFVYIIPRLKFGLLVNVLLSTTLCCILVNKW